MTTEQTPANRQTGFRLNSVFLKLAAGIGLAAALLTFVTSGQYGRAAEEIATQELVHSASEINGLLSITLAGAIRFADAAAIEEEIGHLTAHEDAETIHGLAVNAGGEILASSGRSPALEPELADLARRAIATGEPAQSADGLLFAHPARFGDTVVGALASAWTNAYLQAETQAAHRRVSLIAYGTVAVGILFLIVAIRAWIARPMVLLARSLHRVAHGDLDVEIPAARRNDELGDIGKAVDSFRQTLLEGRESERKIMFRNAALDATSAAIMMVDADMTITDVNPAVLALMHKHVDAFRGHMGQFDPDRLIGMNMDEFHPGALRDRVRRIVSDPANLPHEADINLGDVRITLRISAVTGRDGTVIGYVNQWRDVTDAYFNAAVIEAIENSMMKADFGLDSEVLHVNDHFARAFGRSAGDGQPWAPGNTISDRIAEAFARCNRGEADYDEYRVDLPGAEPRVLEGGFTPVMDRKGNVIRVSFIGKDVTAAKQSLARAAADREALQAAQAEVVDGLRGGLERLADGDLTARIDAVFAADYEQLRADFNRAVDRLQEAMRGVAETADLIQGEANEIASAADDLSKRTERQAATLEQTASALDELTSSVKSAAEGASHANALVNGARSNAEDSGAVVREAVVAMREIESSSQQISRITGVIDDIAFQTNLLALNAGVEAARAGDAGRGFAVVASEVRALAQRSSDAAREINALISASGGHVMRGVDLVDRTGAALDEIVANVKEISRNVSEIAASAQEQSAGLAEINTAMNQLDQVTQQNAAMFEETTAATHALTREAETLTRTMTRFRTGRPAGSDRVAADLTGARRAPPAPIPAPTPPHGPPGTSRKPGTATAGLAPRLADDDDEWDEF